MQYSSIHRFVWELQGGDSSALKDKIDSLKVFNDVSGTTKTFTTLKAVLQRELDVDYPGRRASVPFVVIIITDGRAKVGCSTYYIHYYILVIIFILFNLLFYMVFKFYTYISILNLIGVADTTVHKSFDKF